jgi:hypothetical protein
VKSTNREKVTSARKPKEGGRWAHLDSNQNRKKNSSPLRVTIRLSNDRAKVSIFQFTRRRAERPLTKLSQPPGC